MLYLFHTGNIFATFAYFQSAVVCICFSSVLGGQSLLGSYCVRSNSTVFQKFYCGGSVMYFFTVLCNNRKALETIVKRSETMERCFDAIVLHLKVYTIVRHLVMCKWCSIQWERELIVEMSNIVQSLLCGTQQQCYQV